MARTNSTAEWEIQPEDIVRVLLALLGGVGARAKIKLAIGLAIGLALSLEPFFRQALLSVSSLMGTSSE